jgi:hypothetical protein
MQPGAVGHPCVHPRTRVVEPSPGLGGESLRKPAHRLVVGEPHLGVLETAATVEVDGFGPVDEHVGDAVDGQQRFERSDSERLASQRVDERENRGAVGQALLRPQRRGDTLWCGLGRVRGQSSAHAVEQLGIVHAR